MSALPAAASWGPLRPLTGYLARHPIVFFLLLTPGIPEYLSGSSALSGLLWSPPVFLIFLAANLGMYGPGVLLIREAMLRWRGGAGALAALAVSYVVMEEGIADATIFDPRSPNVGVLGSYGHFLGVNWVWLPGVLMIHLVYSIAIPIFLFGTAFPALRDRSLLSRRGVIAAFAILTVDVAVVTAIVAGVAHWWDGPVVVAICGVVILAGFLVARRVPPGWPAPPRELPRFRPWAFGLLGFAAFPATVLLEAALGTDHAPAAVTFGAVAALFGLLAVLFYLGIGRQRHRRHLLAFTAGALVPLAIIGFFAGLPIPIVVVPEGLAAFFLYRMWNRCREEDSVGLVADRTISARPSAISAPPPL